jgi:HEPN domain-containing protein
MVDILRQAEFWKTGAEEDRAVARELIANRRIRHALFFAHLSLEKILKAHVCRRTQDLAPRIHNLARLAEAAALHLPPEHLNVLAEMNAFHIEGRYPETLNPLPTLQEAQQYFSRAEEVFRWLKDRL